jgi:hypothetical protein
MFKGFLVSVSYTCRDCKCMGLEVISLQSQSAADILNLSDANDVVLSRGFKL